MSVSFEDLKKVQLFSELQQEVLERISKTLRHLTVNAGHVIVKQGSVANDMFFIISGSVAVEKDGKKVDTSGPGAFFGETALVHDIPRTASVIASDECDLAVLSREAFLNFKNEYTELAQQIQKIADDRFQAFKNTLASLDVGDPATFSEDQVNHFRQIFQDIDADKSGTIDTEELGLLLQRLTGKAPSQTDLVKFMNQMDNDKNGRIDFDEFLSGLRFLSWLVEKPNTTTKPAESSAKSCNACWTKVAVGVAAVTLFAGISFAVWRTKSNKK